MKNALLLLFCLVSLSTHAQVPDYFANDPRWIENEYSAGNQVPPFIPRNTTSLYWIAGDSLVNNVLYKKVMSRSRTTYDYAYPPSFGGGFRCLLRQEGRNIWRLDNQHGALEYLLVSYDYEVGDSLRGYAFEQCGHNTDTIQKIDSVLMNGAYRKVFYVDSLNGPIIIEGVGHMLDASGSGGGFTLPLCMGIGWGNTLLCYAQGALPLWPDQSAGATGCELSLNVADAELPVLAIYPNPFAQYLEVKTADFTEKELVLYDISGKLLLRQAFTEEARIATDHLPAGIYVYELKGANRPAVFGKVVKQ
ncbi:MAG: T9SS type A sorting domain-containing protein [Sphingobacteriaceae bacterium]|nr:T9SS type A sorting domain-containing protein [Sphingobacteriaceae bacterium]